MKVLAFASLLAFIFFTSHFAQAIDYSLFPLLSEARYQKSESQQMVFRPYTVFALGIDWSEFSFLIERAKSDEKSGNSTLSTRLEQTSYLVDGRWLLYRRSAGEKFEFQILPSVGLGAHQDKVTTDFFSSSSEDLSNWESLVTLGIVARGRLNFFIFEFEVRALSGKLLDPTTAVGGVLRLGAIF